MQHVAPANVEEPAHGVGRVHKKAVRFFLLDGLLHARELGGRAFAGVVLAMRFDRRVMRGGAILPEAVDRIARGGPKLQRPLSRSPS